MSMKKTRRQGATLVLVLLGISACASQRPVLSPNEQLLRVGPEVGERDIDECLARANEATATESAEASTENVATGAATSSVVGAAAGAAGGAIVGEAGRGAAAGSVGGLAASLMHTLLQAVFRSQPPPPSTRQFVDRCLRAKGYEPAGWR